MWLVQSHTASKWKNQGSNSGIWIHCVSLPLRKGPRDCGWPGCRGPRKERSRFPIGTEEQVLPEQGQSAASIEGTDAVLEQGPQLWRHERQMSRVAKTAGCGRVGRKWELLGGSHQSLQVPLSGIEYLRAQVSHVLCVAQVSDGEVDNKRHQERNCSCREGESKVRPILGQAWGWGREGSKDMS